MIETQRSSAHPKVFVSYRKTDTEGVAGRLAAALGARFGEHRVFFDRHTIAAGERFDDRIETAVANAEVVLVLIGTQWLRAQDRHGRRRLSQRDDWVRREVVIALTRGRPIIPLLVNGAELPDKEALDDEPELVNLTTLQATVLRESEWKTDLAKIFKRIVRLAPDASSGLPPVVDPPRLAWRTDTPVNAPPLDLQTAVGLERGHLIALVEGIDAADLLSVLRDGEARLLAAVHADSAAPQLPLRNWTRLRPERINAEVATRAALLAQCDPYAEPDKRRGTPDAEPATGLVIGIDQASYADQHRGIESAIGVFAAGLSDRSTQAVVFVLRERTSSDSRPLAAHLRGLIARACPGIHPLDLVLGHRRPIQRLADEACADHVWAALTRLDAMDDVDQLSPETLIGLLAEDLEPPCDLVVLDRSLLALRDRPKLAAILVEAIAKTAEPRLRRDILHLICAEPLLVEAWVRGLLSRSIPRIELFDLIPTAGVGSVLDPLVIGLLRVSDRYPLLAENARDMLSRMLDDFPVDPIVRRLVDQRETPDSTRLRLSWPGLFEDLRSVQWGQARSVLDAGPSSGLEAEGLIEILSVDSPGVWWALTARPLAHAALGRLLAQPAEKRAVFGLCTRQEWKTITRRPILAEQVLACRGFRSLVFGPPVDRPT